MEPYNAENVQGHLQGLSEEFAKLSNLPAVDQGAAVFTVLNAIRQSVERLEQAVAMTQQTMQQNFVQIRNRLGTMDVQNAAEFVQIRNRLGAMDIQNAADRKNVSAQKSNVLISPRDPSPVLSPLYNTISGLVITGFPRTLHDYFLLDIPEIDGILRELGVDLEGLNDEMKRNRLADAIGLRV